MAAVRAGGWLNELLGRAAARGMSSADLARAAGMRPSNFRRMLENSAASPRLESVMRLLAPLGCRIIPAGARTASELAAFLEDERRRRGMSWEELLVDQDTPATKLAERLGSAPEMLSLAVVMQIAEALKIELTIVADDDAATPTPTHEREARAARPRHRAEPRAPSAAPRRSHSSSRPPPARAPAPESQSPPTAQVPPAPSVSHESQPPSPWRLRPPRLGRYRDAPQSNTRPVERQPPAQYTPPATSYALERNFLGKLADLSSDEWADTYSGIFTLVKDAAEVPREMITTLASATERWFHKFRRSPTRAEPVQAPDLNFDDADPAPLVRAWMASKEPDERTSTTWTVHDDVGRAHVLHLALDDNHGVMVRLAQGGRSHALVRTLEWPRRQNPATLWQHEVPLELQVGDERGRFEHVHAGPVFGELFLAGKVFLLASVSWAIVLVQLDSADARVVWGGRAEQFVDTRIEAPAVEPPSAPAPAPTASPNTDTHLAALARELEDERRQRAALEAQLTAERAALADESTRHAEAQREAEEARAARASVERENLALQQDLAAERSARLELEETARATVMQLITATMSVNHQLQDAQAQQLAAQKAAEDANAQQQTLTSENAELRRKLADWEAAAAQTMASVTQGVEAARRAQQEFEVQFLGLRERTDAQFEQHKRQQAELLARLDGFSARNKVLEEENMALRRRLSTHAASAEPAHPAHPRAEVAKTELPPDPPPRSDPPLEAPPDAATSVEPPVHDPASSSKKSKAAKDFSKKWRR